MIESKIIYNLRFILTLGVVFIHFNLISDPFIIHERVYGLHFPIYYYYVIDLFSDVLPRVSVPLFFFFSGYLFFFNNNFTIDSYKQKLFRRFRTLMIPYFLWNSIALMKVFIIKLPLFSALFPNAYKIDICFSLGRLFDTFFFNENGVVIYPDSTGIIVDNPQPIDGPLWYVRDLFSMIIISPIIYMAICKFRRLFLIIVSLLWFYMTDITNKGYPVQLATALFFFSWGGVF